MKITETIKTKRNSSQSLLLYDVKNCFSVSFLMLQTDYRNCLRTRDKY